MSGRQVQHTQLKWHNTLPEDFSSRKTPTTLEPLARHPSGRKRLSASSEGLNSLSSETPAESLPPSSDASGVIVASPTKRNRLSTGAVPTKTPTKTVRETAAGNSKLGGSGMQTPPPSSTGTARRRGRSQKTLSASKSTPRIITTQRTSPSKIDRKIPRTAEVANSISQNSQQQSGDQFTHKAMVWDDGLDLGREETEQAQFDWALVRGENLFPDIFTANSSLNPRATSPLSIHTASDSAHFSFMGSDRSDIIPHSVDPNLIFSEPSSATSSMIDDVADGRIFATPSKRPYHHQYLQRQRDKEERLRRRKSQIENVDVSNNSLRTSRSYNSIVRESSLSRSASGMRSSSNPHRSDGVAPLSAKITNTRLNTSPTRIGKTRTELVLEISPSGRAKAQTKVVYELEKKTEVAPDWDSLDESDSSFDGDTPRGLAPDGSEYCSFRLRSGDPFEDLALSSSAIPASQNSVPFTPKKTGLGYFAASNAATATRRNVESSSPRLPTPLRSSPPPSMGKLRRVGSSIASMTPQLPIPDDEGSEAETVVDEALSLQLAEESEDDAVAALRKAIGRGRNGTKVQETPTKSLAGSVGKHHTYSGRSQSVGPSLRSTALFDTSLSSPIKKKLFNVQTTRKSGRRRPIADGGFYPLERDHDFINTSPTVATEPDYSTDREATVELEEEEEGETRCICGRGEGKVMVQWLVSHPSKF
ncbi:hypothetical protein EDC01DRAFT_628081 [Geopyxis carbonaria]|nr:hypothetical protein EDC01DRAFT_628081 [Geopyxis carbonaria]